MDPEQIIPDVFLKEAIARIRSLDKKTIKKGLEDFEKMKIIERISLGAWRLLRE